jgi:predicted nucleotidyltransferase
MLSWVHSAAPIYANSGKALNLRHGPEGEEGAVSMAVPAEMLATRAADWARADAAVRAAVVYGSLAQGTAGEHSDLDLIIVAESGQRDALWERQSQISELVHRGPVVWSQEPYWQRPYRYQTWDENLIELDLTLDEEYVIP